MYNILLQITPFMFPTMHIKPDHETVLHNVIVNIDYDLNIVHSHQGQLYKYMSIVQCRHCRHCTCLCSYQYYMYR